MNFDSSGAQYLRRLKQDLEPPQGLPAPAATTAPAESPTPPSERRQSPRYKCEGSAEFRVEGSDVRTWGTFTDLSLGGCYVEMKATFPVGAMVDLALELNGVRAQVKGEVRISYPFLGIGIAFREVTPENQLRLEEMVYSLRPFPATVPSPIPSRSASTPPCRSS